MNLFAVVETFVFDKGQFCFIFFFSFRYIPYSPTDLLNIFNYLARFVGFEMFCFVFMGGILIRTVWLKAGGTV